MLPKSQLFFSSPVGILEFSPSLGESFRFDTVEKLKQQYVFVPEKVKDCYLIYLLRNTFDDKTAIIFTTRYKFASPFPLLLETGFENLTSG